MILDIGIKARDYLHLVAMEFPIHIVSLKGFEKSLNIYGRSRLTSIVEKSNKLSPPPYGEMFYNFCGTFIDTKQSALECGLMPNNKLFQEVGLKQVIIEVKYFKKVITLELEPNNFRIDVRRHFREWRLPPGTLDSLEQLLIWRVTTPNYTEARPPTKPIKIIEEMLDNPKLRPMIDYEKLQKKTAAATKTRIGLPEPFHEGATTMPPMKLHKRPITIEVNKDDGIMSLLGRRFWRVMGKTEPTEQPIIPCSIYM